MWKNTSGCVASVHNMHSLGRSKQVVPRVCFRNSFKTESSVHNSALLQFRYPTLGPKFYHEFLFESFTDQLLSDRHVGSKWFSFDPSYARASAHTFKLFLLVSMVYVLCDPINVSYLLHCCLYLSLELLSKGGCAQCQGTWILRSWWFYSLHMSFAQTCHMSYTIDYLSEGE